MSDTSIPALTPASTPLSAAAWHHQLWTRARSAAYGRGLTEIAQEIGMHRNNLTPWLYGTHQQVHWASLLKIEAWVVAWERVQARILQAREP